MTIQEAYRIGTAYLASFGISSPALDTELILCDLTRKDRAALISHSDRDLSVQEESVLWEWLDRRARHCPLQYLRGKQEFFGRDFEVSPEVLIPRPETEILVEACLELIRRHPGVSRILEIGTGSGCIAVSLTCEIKGLIVTALDISESALKIARRNASRLPIQSPIEWLVADGLTAFGHGDSPFDLIVSNPPYISDFDPLVEAGVR